MTLKQMTIFVFLTGAVSLGLLALDAANTPRPVDPPGGVTITNQMMLGGSALICDSKEELEKFRPGPVDPDHCFFTPWKTYRVDSDQVDEDGFAAHVTWLDDSGVESEGWTPAIMIFIAK